MSFEEGVLGKASSKNSGGGLYNKIKGVAKGFHERFARIFPNRTQNDSFRSFDADAPTIGKRPKEKGFHPGFEFDAGKKDFSFQQGISGENIKTGKEGFKKGLNEEKINISPTQKIDVKSLSPTKLMTIKDVRLTLRTAKYYNEKGEYQETLPIGTSICADISKPLFTAIDPITGKPQVYMAIRYYSKDKESVTLGPGFIRATWLNSRLQEKKKEAKPEEPIFAYKTESKRHEIPTGGYNTMLEGIYGPGGEILSLKILIPVIKKYFGNKIEPEVAMAIKMKEVKIGETRERMKAEFLKTQVPLDKSVNYKIQLEQIKEKKKMEGLHYSIKSFTMNNNPVVTDPNIVQILTSLQKTRNWQEILQVTAQIQRAAYIQKSKKVNK